MVGLPRSANLFWLVGWPANQLAPTTRGGAAAARMAHNHEVAGSSPAPATKKNARPCVGLFSWLFWQDAVLRLAQALLGCGRRFGVASKRAEVYFEHLRVEKGEARCPTRYQVAIIYAPYSELVP